MPTLEEINAYIKALASHDWYHSYSDDNRVWRAGVAAEDALKAKAKSHPIYQTLLDIHSHYIFAAKRTPEGKTQLDEGIADIRRRVTPAANDSGPMEPINQMATS